LTIAAYPASYHRAIAVSILSRENSPPGYYDKLGDWQKLYLAPKELLSLYLHYFSPNNLFFQNDYNPQRIVEGFSVFYLWQLPLLIFGVWKFIKTKLKESKNLLLWIFLTPIPAALTADPFHTYRAILLFLPLTILTAVGFEQLLVWSKKMKGFVILASLFVLSYFLLFYFFQLLNFNPIARWRDWDYGYSELSKFIKSQPETLRVVIDDINTESYIHLLFNQVVPISEYQAVAGSLVGGDYYKNPEFLRPEKVGRFEFRSVDWPTERGDLNTLFIFPSNRLYPSEFSGDPKLKLEKIIYAPSGEPAFYLVKTINEN